MGVIATYDWLEENFTDPLKVCEQFKNLFHDDDPKEIYQYLTSFGMYQPTKRAKEHYDWLKKEEVWGKVTSYYKKYKKAWNGPEVDIFIFPFHQTFRSADSKSGVSFPTHIFLFISEVENDKEIEALFVHEYHHVCRIHKLGKKLEDYTLLDSIILEGLAEHAVKENCGKSYNAKWCHYYNEEKIINLYKNNIKSNLSIKKSEELHDALLYGFGRYPKMLGYSCGYTIIDKFNEYKSFSEKIKFSLESEKFINIFEKLI